MTTIYKGDATGAFGGRFLTIRLRTPIPEGYSISKAEIKIGNLPTMVIKDPEFPLLVNLTPAQTRQLQQQNIIKMKIYDNEGNGVTCKGQANFIAKDKVV